MSFDADSSCVDAIRPAVNFGERRGAKAASPDILLLHYTGMEDDPGGDRALNWLCCEESGVSCHYLIRESGEVVQMVPESKRAHHAGVGKWEGDDDTNSRSIGIEIVNGGHPAGLPDFPALQMEAVLALSKDILARHDIAPRRVLAHSDIAPGRKVDPIGPFWRSRALVIGSSRLPSAPAATSSKAMWGNRLRRCNPC